MLEGEPSRTAYRVAMRRAVHQVLDEPRVLDDPLALRVVDPEHAATLRRDPGAFERSRIDPYLRAFMVARSRFAEDALAERVARGVRQYVLLGAGLDTFAYRNPHEGVRVFEVDHPATQRWKRESLARGGVAVPGSVTFVSTDFESGTLGDTLASAGLDLRAPTLFAMLGVVPYLTLEALDEVWSFVAARPRGGGIVFDYSIPPSAMSGAQRRVFEAMADRVAAAGEPWRTTFGPAVLAERLRGHGFTVIEDLGADEINARWFGDRTDGLRVGGAGRLAAASS